MTVADLRPGYQYVLHCPAATRMQRQVMRFVRVMVGTEILARAAADDAMVLGQGSLWKPEERYAVFETTCEIAGHFTFDCFVVRKGKLYGKVNDRCSEILIERRIHQEN
jgi:hypothetical protein